MHSLAQPKPEIKVGKSACRGADIYIFQPETTSGRLATLDLENHPVMSREFDVVKTKEVIAALLFVTSHQKQPF